MGPVTAFSTQVIIEHTVDNVSLFEGSNHRVENQKAQDGFWTQGLDKLLCRKGHRIFWRECIRHDVIWGVARHTCLLDLICQYRHAIASKVSKPQLVVMEYVVPCFEYP